MQYNTRTEIAHGVVELQVKKAYLKELFERELLRPYDYEQEVKAIQKQLDAFVSELTGLPTKPPIGFTVRKPGEVLL